MLTIDSLNWHLPQTSSSSSYSNQHCCTYIYTLSRLERLLRLANSSPALPYAHLYSQPISQSIPAIQFITSHQLSWNYTPDSTSTSQFTIPNSNAIAQSLIPLPSLSRDILSQLPPPSPSSSSPSSPSTTTWIDQIYGVRLRSGFLRDAKTASSNAQLRRQTLHQPWWLLCYSGGDTSWSRR